MADTIREYLIEQANTHSDSPVFLTPYCASLSYGQLLSHIQGVAMCLRSHGISRQSRVGVILPNGPELGGAILAITSCAVCVPINPALSATEIKNMLSLLKVEAVILLSGSTHIEVCQELSLPIFEIHRDPADAAGIFSLDDQKISGDILDWAGPNDIAVIYHTSGTTSHPKVVPITQRNLCEPMPQFIEHYKLSPLDRIICPSPMFYAFGASDLLIATVASGGSAVFLPDYSTEALLLGLVDYKATRFAASPAVLEAVAEHIRQQKLPPREYSLRYIRSGAGAINPPTVALLEKHFGVPFVVGYGLTEIGVSQTATPLPPRKKVSGSVGVAIHGEITVMDQTGTLLPALERGEIVTRGPGVFSGYENNNAANDATFCNGWFRTGDEGYMDDDGNLFIIGRLKEIINHGGQKVVPREVDEALMNLPEVREAVCFSIPHPRVGENVAAAVVLRPDAVLTAGDLRRMLRTVLADFKIPSQIIFLHSLPRTANFKIQRNNLYHILYEQFPEKFGPGSYVEPKNQVEAELASIWQEMLHLETVGVEEDFFALGGDSLQATMLIAEIEKRWGKVLPASVMMEAGTIAELAARVIDKEADPGQLVAIQPEGKKRPLFCIHARDGDVMQFRNLKHYLSNEQPIYGIRFVENIVGEKKDWDIPRLATEYIRIIKGVQPVGPYRIIGHSFGGMVAYEIACQLSMKGDTLEFLGLLDTASPRFRNFKQKAGENWKKFISLSPRDWGGFWAERGTKLTVRIFRLLVQLPKIQEPFQEAADNYLPKTYYGNVIFFRSIEDLKNASGKFKRCMGWTKYVNDRLQIVEVPGDHVSILLEPDVQILAAKIQNFLSDIDLNCEAVPK